MVSRYDRQTRFEPIGSEGQERIRQAHVLLVGCGALGTTIADTLVRAGVGKITIIDRDYVERHNLHRQRLFTEADADNKVAKAKAAARYLKEVNADVDIDVYVRDFQAEEAAKFVPKADLLMDGSDNFELRLLLNDAAYRYGVPWICGGVVGSYGLSRSFMLDEGPCLRCLSPYLSLDETCDSDGVIAPAVQMVTALQSAEALKIISGNESAVAERLRSFDLWTNETATIDVTRLQAEDCPTCGPHATYPSLLNEAKGKQVRVLCGGDTVHVRPRERRTVSMEKLQTAADVSFVRMHEDVATLDYDGCRIVLFKDGRALLHGVDQTDKAEQVYERVLSFID
ncbi:ThiF family adenylyltransferase [Natribacillus halophilus]|uniref:Molybdopterin or thiamine biosynthesis adenylyltransferase n=1 Tax=Natribacillus halophilus TaxID=549003 RepID=A0A1G8QA36_9BACI|nr:ThiF family adenylyltransferase [Natribacillus halophilus]SDJ01654.1 Molybdopterin or thiamine biosynthesis adenylyltransferase [Natribacillus halophilus]